MRWFLLCWLAAVAAVLILDVNWTEAAPSPRDDDTLKKLMALEQMYSSVARPRFGKRLEPRTNSNSAPNEYEGQYLMSEEVEDWLPVRR